MTQICPCLLGRSPLLVMVFLLGGHVWGSICTASPITLWENDPEKLIELIESDAFVAASEPVEEEHPAQAPPRVVPPQPPLIGLSGQSMTGTSGSSTVVASAGGVGLTTDTTLVPPPVARRFPVGEQWLFIPPRFLDGVFRPLRFVVSLWREGNFAVCVLECFQHVLSLDSTFSGEAR